MPPISSPNIRPKPMTQKTTVPSAKSMTFFMTMLPAFFARVRPVSTIAKPGCMKKTSAAPSSTQIVSTATNRPASAASAANACGAAVMRPSPSAAAPAILLLRENMMSHPSLSLPPAGIPCPPPRSQPRCAPPTSGGNKKRRRLRKSRNRRPCRSFHCKGNPAGETSCPL